MPFATLSGHDVGLVGAVLRIHQPVALCLPQGLEGEVRADAVGAVTHNRQW